MNDKIKIQLPLAGFSFSLTIEREKEEMVRLAAKKVDQRLYAYRTHYEELSPERVLSMVAFQFALETLQLKERNDTEPFKTKIKGWGELLDEQL